MQFISVRKHNNYCYLFISFIIKSDIVALNQAVHLWFDWLGFCSRNHRYLTGTCIWKIIGKNES